MKESKFCKLCRQATAEQRCKKCLTFLCNTCSLRDSFHVFCSTRCQDDFKAFQLMVSDKFFITKKRFSFFGAVKSLIITLVLIGLILTIIYINLGTLQPREILNMSIRTLKLLF